MPSKRERGKQRKAAKDIAIANRDSVAAVTNDAASETILQIQRGNTIATRHAIDYAPPSYAESGILPSILGFLKRCETESFAVVIGSVRGDLNTPVYWIKLLICAIEHEPSCRMQVAQNIGPMVRSMCADTTRLFFKSTKHWKESILEFVHLIARMVLKTDGRLYPEQKSVFDTLLQHEGLVESIIQWSFWGKEYRPDIAGLLSSQHSAKMFYWGEKVSSIIIANAVGIMGSPRDKKMVEFIFSLPIVSKDYDPTCMVSYVAGLIQLLKKIDDKRTRDKYETELRVLVQTTLDLVDKGVIKEMIDFGLNNTTDLSSAKFAVNMAYVMVLQKTNSSIDKKILANDTRVAFAVRAGLVEMCLSFVERFGQSRLFSLSRGDENSLFQEIQRTIETVYLISLHKKTAKAIASKRVVIEKELLRLRGRDIPNHSDYDYKDKKLLYLAKSVLDLSGTYCCRCNKSLSKTEVLQCNGCSGMVYCSKSCQKEDWLNGHSLTCNKKLAIDQPGRFQGLYSLRGVQVKDERAASKLKELKNNISMIQLKLFLDKRYEIQSRAHSLGIPLYDCVVVFDLQKCPPSVETKKYTSAYDASTSKHFEETRSKDNITCIYHSPHFNGESGTQFVPNISMQRLFPHEWLSGNRVIRHTDGSYTIKK